MNQQEIIMSRVLFLHRLKRACCSPWTKLLLLGGFAVAELSLVSVYHVIKNVWQVKGLTNTSHYFLSALVHTNLAVQLLLAGLASVALLLVWDVWKNFRSHRQLAAV